MSRAREKAQGETLEDTRGETWAKAQRETQAKAQGETRRLAQKKTSKKANGASQAAREDPREILRGIAREKAEQVSLEISRGATGKGKQRWRTALFVVLALALLFGYMALEGDVVRIRYADVTLADLPEAFNGTRVLFLSDIHLGNFTSPEKSAALIAQLQSLNPDILLLGGDYSSLDALDYARSLTGETTLSEAKRALTVKRDQFFLMIRDFEAPLGKYMVPGNHDYELKDLDKAAALGKLTLLKNSGKVLSRGEAKLIVAGLDDWRSGEQDVAKVAGAVRGRDCVLLLCHNPDALPSVVGQPCRDDALWADLTLAGHTHGGQIALFGHGLFTSSIYGDRYLSGWYEEHGSLMLVSNGVGGYLAPLRLGAPPQAHLITLYKK